MATIIAMTVLASPAFAGGDSWRAKVVSFERIDNNTAVAHIRFQGKQIGCDLTRIHFIYQPEMIGFRTWSRDLVTVDTHRESLALIEAAGESGQEILLGVMGTGLVPTGSDRCTLASRGLAILEQVDGARAVFSFHNPV